MDEQQVWAWKCENCRNWMRPGVSPTAVLVKEPDHDLQMVDHVEMLYVTRKMVICPICVENMRTRG